MTKHFARLIGLLIAVFTISVAGPAFAQTCDEGDWEDGPNCINQVDLPSKHNPAARSTAYRVSDKGEKTIVWKGRGGVLKSTAKKLEVGHWLGGRKFVVHTYKWDADTEKYVYASTQEC